MDNGMVDTKACRKATPSSSNKIADDGITSKK